MNLRPAIRVGRDALRARQAYNMGQGKPSDTKAGPSRPTVFPMPSNKRGYAAKPARNNVVTKERYNFNTSLNFSEELDPDVSILQW